MRGRAGVAVAVVVAAATLGTAPRAGAAVAIGPDRIVVSTTGAQATIMRRPFHVSFADGAGRTVLAQAANASPSPLVIPPAPRPVPLGSQPPAGPTLYTPLSFTVGSQQNLQYPAGQWQGNQLAGTEAGVQHSAREVVGVAGSGAGVQLNVSTSDPTGRQLIVNVAPGPGATIRFSARPSSADGVATMSDSFASAAGEAFRGFGGRHNALDQRGTDFFNWVAQQNVGAGQLAPLGEAIPGGGGDRYLFPAGPHAAYYVRSDFISSRRYGFLLDRNELSRWRMASDRPDAWQVGVAGAGIDYVVAPGDPPHAISALTNITGRHRVPPGWAIGPILDRAVAFPSEPPASHRAKVAQDLRDIDRYQLPLNAYRVEGYEFFSRDQLRQVIAELRRRGIRPMVYFRAFVGQDDTGTDSPRYYDEAVSRGYVARRADGQPYIFSANFNSPTALIDFTNPAAVAWWQARIREALDLGAEGFMQDFGEQVQVDMHFANGETGATMHNRYPVLFHKTTRDEVDRYERSHPGRRIFFYTRAGYSGAPGAMAYEGGNFPGDETTDWSRSSGLASMTTDMLNRAVGGQFGFTGDIGGYFDVGPYQPTTKELFIRWAQWTALSPLFRLHGSVGAGTHTPWSYDQQTVDLYKQITALHQRAAPLILRLWDQAARTGLPPTRPLWLAYPGDAQAAAQDQEWLLGTDVLVAPVVQEGATSREVYFPAGCWEHPETREVHRGPGRARVQAPLGRLPYFFRCGTSPFDAPLGGGGSCATTAGFRSAGSRPRSGGLDLRFARRVSRPVSVEVLRTTSGSRVIGSRRVILFSNLARSRRWNARDARGRRVPDGFYYLRYRIRTPLGVTDIRRDAWVRRRGRFFALPQFSRPESCGLIYSFGLSGPAFGGRTSKPLEIALRPGRRADFTIQVLRGRRIVKTYRLRGARALRFHRRRVSARGLAAGNYTVRLIAQSGRTRVTATLVSRRI